MYFMMAFKIIVMLLDIVIAKAISDALLATPIAVAIAATEFVITMGADDFTDFLTWYFIGLATMVIERVYTDPYIRQQAMMVPVYKARIQARAFKNTGKI